MLSPHPPYVLALVKPWHQESYCLEDTYLLDNLLATDDEVLVKVRYHPIHSTPTHCVRALVKQDHPDSYCL